MEGRWQPVETLMAVVRSEYFPAGAVLVGVVLFWTIGLLGGLSWLSGAQQPLAILTWMIFIYGVVDAFVRKQQAADNPWGAGATTLEWTLSSPPPFHQFETLPRVQ